MSNDDKPDLLDWLGLRADPVFSVARWLGPAISVAIVLLILLAVVAAFTVLIRAVFFGLPATPGAGLGTGAVAVAIIGAPFVIWRSMVAQRQADIAEQGLITDRLNTAVQGLGAEKTVKRDGADVTQPNLEVRIGAIYALERIAQDSARDHVQIMEILCAYIRHNAPAPQTDDWPELEMRPGEGDGPLKADWRGRLDAFRQAQEEAKAKLENPRADIQTALTVIGRRGARRRRLEAGWGQEAEFPFDTPCPDDDPKGDHDPTAFAAWQKKLKEWRDTCRDYEGYRLDLRHTDLRGADLAEMNLAGARLDGAHLHGANLGAAQLQGASLGEARLQGASLWGARLQGAFLRWAWLQGAFLQAARLQGASLGEARLQGAILLEARLQGAFLHGARLQGADLREARLQGAFLWWAQLQGADLWWAQLQGANLGEARLQGATNLNNATLRGAALRAADLTNAPQIAQHLPGMFGDASVILPEGVAPPAHWPNFALYAEFESQWHKWQADPEGYTPPDAAGG